MKTKTSTIAAIAIALSAFVGASALAQTTLRIQDYPGFGNFLVRVANANGLCEKHGIKCELKTIPQAPLGIQTLLAGELEVAFPATEVAVQAVAKGADLKAISSNARELVFFLMAGAHVDTPSSAKGYPAVMHDFKGKKVGVTARGSGAEFQLIEMLKGAGMSAEDVTIVPVGAPNTAFPAIANKQIDGLVMFAPMDGFCEVSKACRVVVDPRKRQGPAEILKVSGAAALQVVRADYAAKNPDAIKGYVAAMREAEKILQNPANFDAMFKIAQNTFKLNMENGDKVLEISLRNTLPTYHVDIDPKALQFAADQSLHNKQIDKAVDTSKLLQPQ